MEWEVLFTDAFGEWWDTLTGDQQDAVVDRVDLLQQHGPNLGCPTVGTISGSIHNNMKELRASKGGALRILFIFDPIRRAILLLGGNKSGQWEHWYYLILPRVEFGLREGTSLANGSSGTARPSLRLMRCTTNISRR